MHPFLSEKYVNGRTDSKRKTEPLWKTQNLGQLGAGAQGVIQSNHQDTAIQKQFLKTHRQKLPKPHTAET